MNKILYKLFTIRSVLFALCVLVSWAPTTISADPKTSVVTGYDGVAVTVIGQNARIVSLAPSATELLFHVDGGKQLVGRTDNCNFPPAALNVNSVGTLFPPNLEHILRLKPDLVLMTSGTQKIRADLRARGIAVYVMFPTSLLQIPDEIRNVGTLIGRRDIAVRKAQEFTKALNQIKAPRQNVRPKVYWEIWSNPMMTVGQDTFVNELIHWAGADNIFGELTTEWPKVGAESIVRRRPEFIFTVDRSSYLSGLRPWAQSLRIPQSKIISIKDKDSVNRPSIRVLDGIEWLKKVLAKAT